MTSYILLSLSFTQFKMHRDGNMLILYFFLHHRSLMYSFIYFLHLFITALWVYIYRHRSFIFLALAMFFPSIFAIGIHIYHGSFIRFISFLLFNPQWSTIYWSVFASLSSSCHCSYLLFDELFNRLGSISYTTEMQFQQYMNIIVI